MRSFLRLGLVAFAATILLALPGAVAEAAFPGTNGVIAFQRGADIYSVTTDSAPTVSSSPLVSGGSEPAWSPDGTKLAYVEAGTSAIKVLTVGGSTSAALDTGTSPAWSPDGTMITYEKSTDIWVVSSSGGTARNLSNSGAGADDDDPAWSPDGDHIAFTRTIAANADIWTMDAPTSPTVGGGGTQQALTTAVSNEIQPNYAPAGNRIAYASDRHGVLQRQIYSIATSGGTETRITSSSTDDTHPGYSPDGVRLAFARATSGIHTTDAQLTSTGTDTNPDWQPTAPTNTTLPVISGSPSQGSTLFASTGTFAGSASSYAYQWRRCDSDGNNCTDIAGATASSYTVVAADVGKRLRVRVTATGGSGSSSATSDPTAVIAGPEPKNTVPPRVIVFGTTGVPVVGATLSSSAGSWTGSGFPTFTYQWKKCQPKEGPCYAIAGANSSTFVPTRDLIGWYLRIEVTATNSFGSTTEQSESAPAVIGSPPVNLVRPRISVFAVPPTLGQVLTVDSGTWSGLTPIVYSYEWRRCDAPGTLPSCVRIAGATSTQYTTAAADLGVTLRVYVTASGPGGVATAISDHTFPTIPAPRLGPAMTRAPAITGDAELGGKLTATRGTWSGFAPIRYVTVWQRCDATATVCRAVKTVKGLAYSVTAADIGYRIRLSVVAVNPIGSVRARSEATEPIFLGPPKPKGRRVVGNDRPNYLPGGGGDDILLGRGGNDTLVGGAGDDRLDGGAGNDFLDGGVGEDRIFGGLGSDTVLAADGDKDRISCGDGNDWVSADPEDTVEPDCEAVTRSAPPAPGDDEPEPPRP